MDTSGCWVHIVILFLMTISSVGSEYVTHKNELTWTQAKDICTLAQPDIIYTKDKEFLDIDANMLTGDTDEAWVGYLEAVTPFTYKGCWKKSDLYGQSITSRTKFGVCYSACPTKLFSITKNTRCICLTSLNPSTAVNFSKCSSTCDDIACGKESFASVYQLAIDDQWPRPRDTDKECLTIDNTITKSWRPCSDNDGNISGIICKHPSGTTTPYSILHGTKKWFDQVTNCPEHGTMTRDEVMENITSDINKVYWTMDVGISAINRADNQPFLSRPLKFGYAERDGDKFELKFRENTEQSAAYCETATTTATHSTTEVTSMVTSETSTTHQSTHTDSDEQTSINGLNVGLGVGLTILIVAVALVVVCIILRWKRRKPLRERPDNSAYGIDHSAPSHDISKPMMADYAILEPASAWGTVPISAATPSENVYDLSDSPVSEKRIKPGNANFNVYNIASKAEPDDVYDHTTDGPNFATRTAGRTTSPSDNFYDVSGSPANDHDIELDHVYNMANDVDSEANVYNHTNEHHHESDRAGKVLHSDNVYNTALGIQSSGDNYDHVTYTK